MAWPLSGIMDNHKMREILGDSSLFTDKKTKAAGAEVIGLINNKDVQTAMVQFGSALHSMRDCGVDLTRPVIHDWFLGQIVKSSTLSVEEIVALVKKADFPVFIRGFITDDVIKNQLGRLVTFIAEISYVTYISSCKKEDVAQLNMIGESIIHSFGDHNNGNER